MSHVRSLVTLAFGLVAGVVLSGCGGGGGGGGSSTGFATLQGSVILRNGSTSNLGGIQLTNPNTGKTVTTSSNGSFDFGTVPAGTLTIKVGGPLAAVIATREAESGGSGGGGADDGAAGVEDASGDDDINDDVDDDSADGDSSDDGDNHDVGDDDADTTGVSAGEVVNVRLAIRDGVIESIQFGQSHGDDRECEARLTPCATSDDLDAHGEIRIESRPDRERFKIEVEHLTAGRSVVAVVIDGSGNEASLGARAAGLTGEVEWSLNTANGDTLPFGVGSVADLVGFEVEVRDAADASISIVCGTIGDLPLSAGDDSHVDSEGREGVARVNAPVGSEAHVKIKHRTGDEARDEFEAEVEHMVSGDVVDVWLENPASLGTFSLVGSMTVGGEGEGRLEISTQDGDTLPFGVTSAGDLAGLHVEFRTPGGVVLFAGLVPALATH